MRTVRPAQFDSAIEEIQTLGLGVLVRFGKKTVLIKKAPSRVKALLLAYTDLCTIEEYTSSYRLPVPVSVSRIIRNKLIVMGY